MLSQTCVKELIGLRVQPFWSRGTSFPVGGQLLHRLKCYRDRTIT
jgi:hypothetical protein